MPRRSGFARRLRTVFDHPAFLPVLIFVIGFAVRVYLFGSVPNGMNQDEASLAYDSWSLAKYGVERNGTSYPVILPAFGSGMSGTLAAYLAMPFMTVWGLNPVTARIVNLLTGLLALPLMYGIGKEVHGRRTGLLAMALLAVSPWHIIASRWGLDCNLFPNLFLLGFYLLLRARTHHRLLPFSFAVFSLCLYAYATTFVFMPLFLACVTVLYWLKHKPLRHVLAVAWAAFLIIAVPIAAYIIVNTFDLPSFKLGPLTIPNLPVAPRYEEASSLYGGRFLKMLHLNGYALWRMVVWQEDGQLHNAVPGFGILYPLSAPFMLLGFCIISYRACRKRNETAILLLGWLGASLAVATVLMANINRLNILPPLMILFAALGMERIARKRFETAAIVLAYAILFGWFTSAYFGWYAKRIEAGFQPSALAAIREAAKSTDRRVCVSTAVNVNQIAVMFAAQPHPLDVEKNIVYLVPNALFRPAAAFDRFTLSLAWCPIFDANYGAYVVSNNELQAFNPRQFSVLRFGDFNAVIRK